MLLREINFSCSTKAVQSWPYCKGKMKEMLFDTHRSHTRKGVQPILSFDAKPKLGALCRVMQDGA